MSAISSPGAIPTQRRSLDIEKFGPIGLVLGLILLLAMFFTKTDATAASQSYLFGYIFWMTITLGCFGMFLLYHLVRGKWLLPVIRMLEAGGGVMMLAVMFVLFLPIMIPIAQGSDVLYKWASASARDSIAILHWKAPYLNPTGVLSRYVIFFGLWIAMAWGLKASTVRQEKSGDLKELVLRNNWSAACFIFFVLSATFAFTDWVMSLDYQWSSTMYGPWTAVAACLGGLSFVTVIYGVNAMKEPYKAIFRPNNLRDLGNILFTLTMLWAYTSLSQYLIIWSGNLPENNFYYVERSKFGWNAIGMVTIIGQFFLPFVMLLTPRNKKYPENLARVAGWMFVIHIVDVYNYVVPAFRHTGPMPTLADALAFFGVGFIWVGVFGMALKQMPLLPKFDLRLEEGVHAH
jgi:hypothetical protein